LTAGDVHLLIVGGTGNISWRLSQAAISADWRVSLLNRGAPDRARRPAPPGCDTIIADINDGASTEATLGNQSFDAVVDFVCYNEAHARRAVSYFQARTGHYIFISTTALYDRRIAKTPLTEVSPQLNDGWDYALAKAGAERAFAKAASLEGFPVTILRPGHTYDTIIPEAVGDGNWTNPWRLLNGKPIVLHGDGTTLWTVTHSSDFALAVVEFLKSGHPPGETFHITSDATHTWREINDAVCREIGVSSPKICYRTTEEIDSIAPRYGNGIKWHKMWCDIYNNEKFKAACPAWRPTVSLEDGIKQTIDYYRRNARLMIRNELLDALLDSICGLRPAF
jgi:nucleoside-diphosphate-sugar epimerase